MAEIKEKPVVEETEKIFVPFDGESDVMVMWINNRRFALRRGEEVDVPVAVAESIRELSKLKAQAVRKNNSNR